MIAYLFVIFAVFGASAVHGQFLNCPWVETLDCSAYSPAPDCGTDGVTYANRCYFAKEQCKNHDLHILHPGACTASETSTTQQPSHVVGHDAVLDFFCTSLSHRDCGTEVQEVCGTDNRTYLNYCEYDKARCTHRNLKVKHFGPCEQA